MEGIRFKRRIRTCLLRKITSTEAQTDAPPKLFDFTTLKRE